MRAIHGLTLGKQRVIIVFVQRGLKKLTAFSLLFLFTIGVWCASLGAPNLSVASAMQPCPKNAMAVGKMDCDQPNFMCSFGLDPRSFSGAVVSPRTHEPPKAALLPIGEVVITELLYDLSLAAVGTIGVSLYFPEKLRIRVFNSVLNL